MTGNQIRGRLFECDNGAYECARFLQEIAAQLADLNQHLQECRSGNTFAVYDHSRENG